MVGDMVKVGGIRFKWDSTRAFSRLGIARWRAAGIGGNGPGIPVGSASCAKPYMMAAKMVQNSPFRIPSNNVSTESPKMDNVV